jgi:penicillin-binding protein 1A
MSRAVAKRPVEEFDTEVQLPEWQLEPDDEYFFGDPGDYYYIDEQGNLIEPGPRPPADGLPFPVEGEQAPDPRLRRGEPGQAASDEFLEEATGSPPPPPMPRTVTPSADARRER